MSIHVLAFYLLTETTALESVEAFEKYIHDQLVRGDVSIDRCGVIKAYDSGLVYLHSALQRMKRDELQDCKMKLATLFGIRNPLPNSTAEWSNTAEAAGLRCGSILIIVGGHGGRGELSIERESYAWCVFF